MAKRKTKDPKVGTGKKPKGSGRRLYTDENPKKTVAKVKKIKKPYARKIQILTVVEQRSKFAGKPQQASIAKKGKTSLKKQKDKKVKK